jgi:hypothetical protein
MITPISQAHKIYKNAVLKFCVCSFGNKRKTTPKIHKKLILFPNTTENRENSIFIKACIRDKTEELSKLKIVKIDTIKIDISIISELYHGRKKAIRRDKKIIIIPKISLRVITFPIIFEAFSLSFEISRIEIV